MKIELTKVKVSEMVNGYTNNQEDGVYGLDNKLNIRPKYQREFIYKPKQQEAVIDTIQKGFPLNVLYWVETEDGTYEVLDGQQRTLSICEYINGGFSKNFRYFHNLDAEEKQQILDYELMVYICKGSNKDKLEWFKTINIAGEKLTDQELRNAVYTGKWLTSAKHYFSKTGCPAYETSSKYMKGSPIRQDYLETVLKWISNDNIEDYMAIHQHDNNANELWLYFSRVMDWVKVTFKEYRKEMKGLPFGLLYNEFGNNNYDADEFENRISELMMDDDVTNNKGIYQYLLTNDEKHLNIRAFTFNQKRLTYERQDGICPICGNHFEISDMEADHVVAWSNGGRTDIDNCQMLCKVCNRRKSNK